MKVRHEDQERAHGEIALEHEHGAEEHDGDHPELGEPFGDAAAQRGERHDPHVLLLTRARAGLEAVLLHVLHGEGLHRPDGAEDLAHRRVERAVGAGQAMSATPHSPGGPDRPQDQQRDDGQAEEARRASSAPSVAATAPAVMN